MAPKKAPAKPGGAPKVDLIGMMKEKGKLKPKKPPPPPASFTAQDIQRYKEAYQFFDEDNVGKIPITVLGTLLRKLGFNPKESEIQELLQLFLEDELVDTIELHELYFMIERKISWGDDVEADVMKAMQVLGHDEKDTKVCFIEVLQNELMTWGDVLTGVEWADFPRLAQRDKTYNVETGLLAYEKFIENINAKDERALAEPVNFFKLDQKTLAKMAMEKALAEKEEMERIAAEKRAREEAKRQRMIADGLLPPD